jgi:hypothetical protein
MPANDASPHQGNESDGEATEQPLTHEDLPTVTADVEVVLPSDVVAVIEDRMERAREDPRLTDDPDWEAYALDHVDLDVSFREE